MSLHSNASVQLPERRAASDWMMGGLGVGCAVLSAGFAAYMIAVGPGAPDPHGSGYFTVFAHFDRRPQYAVARPGPDVTASAAAGRAPDVARVASASDARPIDYAPTGSIATEVHPAAAPADGPVLEGFTVRDVFDGQALVEGRHMLKLVSPGMVLDGAGEVLSIERKKDAWVVVTEDGVIGGPARGALETP